MDALRKFRDNSEGCAPLCWSNRESVFLTADSLGMCYEIDRTCNTAESKDIGCEKPMTQLSVQSNGKFIACGTDSSAFLRPAKAMAEKREETLIFRPTLPVTGLVWIEDGRHL